MQIMRRAPGLAAAAAVAALTQASSMNARAASVAEIANLAGADRGQILLEGARKEGKFTIYSAMIDDQALRPVTEAFKRKYPFIDAQYWRADSRDLVNKALAEARARAVTGDVIEGGGVSQPLARAGVLQSFKTPGNAEWAGDLRDNQGFWAATRLSYFGAAYNTRDLKADDAPKTYDDLLEPKWRGKMCWTGPAETGSGLMFITFMRLVRGEERAEAYLRKLSEQKIVNYTASPREVVNKVMAGECLISLNIFLHHAVISQQKGASVAARPLEPVAANASVATLAKGTQNPHAAMLFIDYLLSKEAQQVLEKADYFPAHPDIAPQPGLAHIVPKSAGLEQRFLTEEFMFSARAKSIELQKKYFQ